MKSITLLFTLAIALLFTSCDAIRQATNTTGGAIFSLNGTWKLTSNTPENTMINSTVFVAPLVSQGTITALANNTQCYRVNDTKWKNIKSDKAGGYTIDNATNTCTSNTISYVPAIITILTNTEIRINSKNAAGVDNVETWTRVK